MVSSERVRQAGRINNPKSVTLIAMKIVYTNQGMAITLGKMTVDEFAIFTKNYPNNDRS